MNRKKIPNRAIRLSQIVTLSINILTFGLMASPVRAVEFFCPNGNNPDPAVIWCDDFEDTGVSVGSNYYEFDNNMDDFARINTEAASGQHSLRARWQIGEVDAGHLMRNFGRNPIGTQSHQGQDFREIYWRHYLKLQNGFIGHPDKVSRVTIFAGANWQQAMIAHIWASSSQKEFLIMDPASGIDANSNLVTTQWNDFSNLIWLGSRQGGTPLVPGQWYCIESHVKLNTPGQSDGIFEFWIDGNLEASRSDLNWVKSWTGYGINSVFLSNHWNQGSPVEQERYLDAFVISAERIRCLDSIPPAPPTGLWAQ